MVFLEGRRKAGGATAQPCPLPKYCTPYSIEVKHRRAFVNHHGNHPKSHLLNPFWRHKHCGPGRLSQAVGQDRPSFGKDHNLRG